MHRRHARPSSARTAAPGAWLLALALTALGPAAARADARTDYLIRILGTSTTFRVRAQAALSLARVEPSTEVVDALSRALGDEHASVRAAAASSLERLEDPRALPALQAARDDADGAVRHAVRAAVRRLERVARERPAPSEPEGPAVRYYVGVGQPGTRVRGVDEEMLRSARESIARRLSAMDGVEVAPEGESPADAERVVRERRLVGFFLDASIVRVEESEAGTRAVVSLLVQTYPGRNMRAMLEGAATVQGGSVGATAWRQAIEGALSGAMRRVPQAFEESAGRGGG